MLARLLSSSRFLLLIAIVGAFLLSTLLLIYGLYHSVALIGSVLAELSTLSSKQLLVSVIELIDLFLLSTVFYVISVGLYELFIDDSLPMPDWLTFHSLDDLKNKLVAVVIVALSVLFLGQIVGWDGQRDLLGYGTAMALVIAALTWFLRIKNGKGE